jgi:hypothetical protein
MSVQLGTKVRDSLSGIEGVVIARTEWLYGCIRITIQPHGAHDGKPFEAFTIDEPQCEIVRDGTAASSGYRRHGPKPEPTRR